MSLSEDLWQANQDVINSCFHSPFIQSLKNGSVDKNVLIRYLVQDAFLLEALSRVYSVAAGKAPDWQSFAFLHQWVSHLIHQIQVRHEEILLWEGHYPQVNPSREAQRYSDFLVSAVWTQNLGVILSAIIPYFRWQLSLSDHLPPLTADPTRVPLDLSILQGSPDSAAIVYQLEALFNRHAATQETHYSAYRQSLLCLRVFLNAQVPDRRSLNPHTPPSWQLIHDPTSQENG